MTTTRWVKAACVLFLAVAGCSGGGANPDSSTAGAAGTTGAGGRGGTTGTAGTLGGGGGGVGGTVGSGGSAGAGPAGVGGGAGTAGTVGAAGTGGTGGGIGGSAGRGGSGGAAGGSSGRGGASAGTGGSGTGGASGGTGGTAARWTCPMGPFTAPNPSSITLTKVAGVPPFDSFNNNGNNFGNIEGDCWLGDALYVSEIASGNNPPPARILRVTATGSVSIAYATSGSNGLAIDLMGRLIGASHTAGGILAFNLTNMTSTPVVSGYMSKRLNTPNDLTVRSDGTIYFSDPDFQAPSPLPQGMTRVYRLPPGATEPIVVDAARSNPNGVTLSLDEKFLFVTDGQGLWRYAVNTDGSTGTATRIAQSAIGAGGDGMVIDCAGNLYVALQQKVFIVDPTGTGTSLGSISMTAVQSVTNVAFGGANHQTLYVSGQGNGMGGSSMGLFRADMPLPGMPY
jgi:gluconolactonase